MNIDRVIVKNAGGYTSTRNDITNPKTNKIVINTNTIPKLLKNIIIRTKINN